MLCPYSAQNRFVIDKKSAYFSQKYEENINISDLNTVSFCTALPQE